MVNKINTELSLSLDIPEYERIKSQELSNGFSRLDNTWELIIKYNGDINMLNQSFDFSYEELMYGYAIIRIKETDIDKLNSLTNILYIDKPKGFYIEKIYQNKSECIYGKKGNSRSS